MSSVLHYQPASNTVQKFHRAPFTNDIFTIYKVYASLHYIHMRAIVTWQLTIFTFTVYNDLVKYDAII